MLTLNREMSKARPNWAINYKKTSQGRLRPGQLPELEEFVSACHYGNLAKVKEILSKHPEFPDKDYVNAKSTGGDTGLHKAAGEGHEDIVEFLLKKEKDAVNNKTGTGETPLHRAAYKGHYGVAELLLDAGANPDSSTSGRTPVYLAKCNGHPRVAQLLIDEGGTDVNCSQRPHRGGGTRRRRRGRKATRRRRVMRGGTRRQGCMRCEW